MVGSVFNINLKYKQKYNLFNLCYSIWLFDPKKEPNDWMISDECDDASGGCY